MLSGFQWFVAWRYLMARPRRWSKPVLWVTVVAAVGALTCTAIAMNLEKPDPTRFFPTGSPYRQPLILTAVGLYALGWLSFVLLVTRRYFTFFTTVSIAGVSIGAMALVIVLSVMSGFEADLRKKILGSNAHVLITKVEGELTEYRDVQARLDTVPGVVAHTSYESSEVVLVANSNYANVIIKGIVPQTVGAVTDLVKNLKEKGALERLYPLTDGAFIDDTSKAPGADDDDDAGGDDDDVRPNVDPPPDDLNVSDDAPIDFSGVDPAPKDLVVSEDDPIDFSGGPPGKTPPKKQPKQPKKDKPGPQPHTGAIDLEGPIDLDPPGVSPRVAGLSGVLVGKELVKQLHLYVGQEVRMVSPLSDPANPGAAPIPYTRNMRVAGTFFTGMYEYDLKFVYVDLAALQQFLDLGDQVQGIEVRVADPQNPGDVVAAIRKAIGPEYLVQDWQELNRNLFSALKLEKIAMFLVLAIIILVASFSIVGNLIMVVVEKAKEIALLKTLGASNTGVMQIFITQGFFIGTVGTLVGVAHGLLACELGSRYGLPLNPDVYYIDRLPIHVESSSVIAVVTAAVVISILATIYPAYVAARLRPVDGLRNA